MQLEREHCCPTCRRSSPSVRCCLTANAACEFDALLDIVCGMKSEMVVVRVQEVVDVRLGYITRRDGRVSACTVDACWNLLVAVHSKAKVMIAWTSC